MAGLYIHIPFCISKCRYCDFVSFAERDGMGEYVSALIDEMKLDAAALPQKRYDTVFIGGGTPSVLPLGGVRRIMDAVYRLFDVDASGEATIEANPGTLTRAKLDEYREAGLNRISMGLQSADDALLKRLGRIHTFAEFCESFRLAREAGFANVSADVMYGLPAQTSEDYLDTIERLTKLEPEHVSAYSLILEENTPLYTAVTGGAESVPNEDETFEMQSLGMKALEGAGYMRYEISNYAKPGFESKHNLNYWNNGEYLGVGLNACSAMRANGWERFANTASLGAYMQSVRAGERPLAGKPESISRREEMFECVMLGTRKVEGMDREAFFKRFGKRVEDEFPKAVFELRRMGVLAEDQRFLRLNERGLDIQNEALLEFMDY